MVHKTTIIIGSSFAEEQQEAIVPPGVYQVGLEIPVGTWTVKAAPQNDFDSKYRYAYLAWTNLLNAEKTGINRTSVLSVYDEVYLMVPEGTTVTPFRGLVNEVFEYSFIAKEGDYVIISGISVSFTPYVNPYFK